MQARGGGSIVALTYLGSERVVPGYNLMGIAKAALEASIRYLAWDLGPANIRVNGISAGPLRTLSARGVGESTPCSTSSNRSPRCDVTSPSRMSRKWRPSSARQRRTI